MYRPHAAREDTVLFPVFRSIVTPREFDELGEKFEDKEHELFGKEGFEKMVESVGEIEKKLGVYDLSSFTPEA
jgi:hemerythrin-like domain-containing protein